jgi:hypothetical protein
MNLYIYNGVLHNTVNLQLCSNCCSHGYKLHIVDVHGKTELESASSLNCLGNWHISEFKNLVCKTIIFDHNKFYWDNLSMCYMCKTILTEEELPVNSTTVDLQD